MIEAPKFCSTQKGEKRKKYASTEMNQMVLSLETSVNMTNDFLTWERFAEQKL